MKNLFFEGNPCKIFTQLHMTNFPMTFYISKIAHVDFSYLADCKTKSIIYDLYKTEQCGELAIVINKYAIVVISFVIVFSILISGCSTTNSKKNTQTQSYEIAPLAGMPLEVQSAPVTVKQAYQFAVANPDILSQLPCYCGCGGMGHTSNYSCYVAGEDDSGDLMFDGHALGCSICVDITQDAMRMLEDGKSTAEILSFVDQTYSRFGPSNME
jgi:hypothetical protein